MKVKISLNSPQWKKGGGGNPATPSQMAAPTVVALSSSELSVDLAAPPVSQGAPIQRFDLRYSTDEASWTEVSDVVGTETLSGLSENTLYFVQTRAVNTVGAGAWSLSGSAATFAVAGVPDQMAAPGVVSTGSSSLSVDRAAAPADGGSPITSFDLRYSADQVSWVEVAGISDPEALSGLTADTTYFVQTRAGNAVGAAPWSTSGSASTDAVLVVPDQMAAPVVVSTGSSSLSVDRAAAPADGGSPIASFDLRYSVDQVSWVEVVGISDPEALSGLTSDTTYFVQTRAVNAVGAAPWSASGSASTDAVLVVPDQMAAPGVVSTGPSSLSVDRAAAPADGGSPITSFDLRYSVDQVSWVEVAGIADPEALSGLAADTTYFVQTRAVNSVGAGAWSASGSAATDVAPMVPGQMSAPTVDPAGTTALTVDRAADPGDGGSPILSFDLRYSSDLSTWTTVTGIGDPETLTGLMENTTYYVQTRAENAVGVGPWSASGMAITDAPQVAPSQMGAPTVTATRYDTLEVTRAAAPSDGGSPILSYDLRYSADQATWSEITGISDPQTVSGLTAATQYFVQTRAVNAIGPGAWSASSSATTPVLPSLYNLAAWDLDVPVNAAGVKTGLNDATEIPQGAAVENYVAPWFQRDAAYFRFVVDSDGSRTSTATYPRCELQEPSYLRLPEEASEHKVVIVPRQLPQDERSIVMQIHTSASPDFKIEVRGATPGSSDGELIFKYRSVSGGTETRVSLRGDVSADTSGVHETLSLRVRRFPDRLEVYHGANVDGVAPDWTTGDADPVSAATTPQFSRSQGDPSYRWQTGNYFQTNQSAPVLTAIIDHVAGTYAAPVVLSAVAPDQMAAPAVSALGSTALSVDRAAAPSDNGWAIASYDLRYSTDQASWTEMFGIADPETINGLQSATGYFVQTRAVNAGGPGPWSASGSATTAAAATAPAQMTAPLVTGLTVSSISADRAGDPDDGGSPITRFDLRYSVDQSAWTEVTDISDPEVLSGLVGGTTYFVETRAVNAVGVGTWSPSGSGATLSVSGNVISLGNWDETRDTGDLISDSPGQGDVIWATSDQTQTLSNDGSGGFLGGTALETGSVPTPLAGQPISFPTSSVTGNGPRRWHAYQRIAGVDSNLISQDYVADHDPPAVQLTSPFDDAVGVATDSAFVLDFDESMERTGSAVLRLVGGAVVETFDLATGNGDGGGSAQWSTNTSTDDRLTLIPGGVLAGQSDYAWRWSGLRDRHRNALPDVTDDVTYNFQTALVGGSPDVVGTAAITDSGGDTTSLAVTLPGGIQAGELLVVFVLNDGGATVSESGGSTWVELITDTQFSQGRGTFFYKTATGGDSFNVTLSALEHAKAIAIRVANHTGIIEATSAFNTSYNPPALTPSAGAGEYLWLAGVVTDAFSTTVSAMPANYTQVANFSPSDGLGGSIHGALAKRVLTAASEDPGAFSTTGGEQHSVFTVGIR